jgi:hypothetical protein
MGALALGPESSPTGRDAHRLGLRVPSPCAFLLLIVVMVQGITPDPNDLASSRGLQFLIEGAHPAKPWDCDEDFQDEVCGPVGTDHDSLIRRSARRDCEAVSRAIDSILEGFSSRAWPIARSRRHLMGPHPSIDLLGHLTC